MYAAIRHYRVNTQMHADAIREIVENFAPFLVERVPGLLAYYVVDAENGTFATITICESQEVLDECSELAAQWMKQHLVKLILDAKDLVDFLVEVGPNLEGSLLVGAPKATNNPFPHDEQKEHSSNTEIQGRELLSPLEVSQELGMGKSWVYQRIRNGEIPSVKLGHKSKVRRQDLEEYLRSQRS